MFNRDHPEGIPPAVEKRLAELETRVDFQEQALSELSDALAGARLEVARSQELLQRVMSDLKQVRTELHADPGEEPPPPHY